MSTSVASLDQPRGRGVVARTLAPGDLLVMGFAVVLGQVALLRGGYQWQAAWLMAGELCVLLAVARGAFQLPISLRGLGPAPVAFGMCATALAVAASVDRAPAARCSPQLTWWWRCRPW